MNDSRLSLTSSLLAGVTVFLAALVWPAAPALAATHHHPSPEASRKASAHPARAAIKAGKATKTAKAGKAAKAVKSEKSSKAKAGRFENMGKANKTEARETARTSERVCTYKGKGAHRRKVGCHVVTVERETAGKAGQAERSAPVRTCQGTVVKHGRRIKERRPCPEPAEPLLTNSPIKAGALEQGSKPVADSAPIKARSAPIRAYAVDGCTFFHNGRKYHIEGLNPDAANGLTHEHATQRLQQILDSGAVALDPISADENGAIRAVVRIGGRNVADLMKQKP